ncbi:MAG TPA: cation:dicarboxylase symporter family transporter, partial [Candidatus Ornithospirochaeta stercorigallinarum]|nr:cation:dicarboxylase symporter family transporter [Candidatus Ornithospirochaeta stercorigallinarum]
MKTWFTYIAAAVFALATAFLFADYQIASSTFSLISTYLVRLGTLITIPVIVFSFPSAIASLRKDRLGGYAASSIITWTLVTSIILPMVPAVFFYLYPSAFPVTSSAGSSGDLVGYYTEYAMMSNINALSVVNPFNTIATASSIVLPLIILSWIFGIFLNPSSDTIRPAYAVMNSFSEIMHKIARFYTVYGYIIAYFSLTDLFLSAYVEKTVIAVPSFLFMLLIITGIIVFALLPILFALFTKFKKNPYKVLFLSISSLVMSLSTGNVLSSVATNMTTSRYSLGVQKRNAVTSTIFFSLFSKGGSAAISTFLILT